jgi:hypothetical protein
MSKDSSDGIIQPAKMLLILDKDTPSHAMPPESENFVICKFNPNNIMGLEIPEGKYSHVFFAVHGEAQDRQQPTEFHDIGTRTLNISTLGMIREAQEKTESKDILVFSCFGGALVQALNTTLKQWEGDNSFSVKDNTNLTIFSSSKHPTLILESNEIITRIHDNLKANPTLTSEQIIANEMLNSAQTITYAKTLANGDNKQELVAIKYNSPKGENNSKNRDSLLPALSSYENLTNYLVNQSLQPILDNDSTGKRPITDTNNKNYVAVSESITQSLKEKLSDINKSSDTEKEAFKQQYLNNALIKAALDTQINEMETLLNLGAAPNYKTSEGVTALQITAIDTQNKECLDLLLKRGANPHATFYGQTVLDEAKKKNNPDIINALTTFIEKDTTMKPSGSLNPYGEQPNPYSPPNPYGSPPNPYGGSPNPYGGSPNPYGGSPNPYTTKFYGKNEKEVDIASNPAQSPSEDKSTFVSRLEAERTSQKGKSSNTHQLD